MLRVELPDTSIPIEAFIIVKFEMLVFTPFAVITAPEVLPPRIVPAVSRPRTGILLLNEITSEYVLGSTKTE